MDSTTFTIKQNFKNFMRVNVHLRTVHLRLSFTADTNKLTKSRTTDEGGLDVCMICVVKIVIKFIIVCDCCSTYLFAATDVLGFHPS